MIERDGGTGTNRWKDAGNWLVGGDVPATPPGAGDDVSITFNASNSVPALVLPDGAEARHVELGGTLGTGADDKAQHRYLLFEGDTEFATFDYLGGQNTYALTIEEGFTLTLSAGDATTPTFKHLATCGIHNRTTIHFDGVITITADPAYLRLGDTMPSSVWNAQADWVIMPVC